MNNITKLVLKNFHQVVKDRSLFLTDTMKRALLADEVLSVMMARYEVEAERATHTNPNVYVDIYLELVKHLEL